MPEENISRRPHGLKKLSLIEIKESLNENPLGLQEKDDGCCGEAFFNGDAPARSIIFGGDSHQLRVENFSILDSNPTNWFSIKSNLVRETPLLQDPTETFSSMNRIMHQTLKYVKEVESIDFNSHAVIDFNGEVMQDPERVFLSVCTSVLANFSFCSQLDEEKLLNFLSNIFESYSKENAYHNALHAADSVQMLFLMLREKPAMLMFTDDEVIVTFLAVLCMSFLHPGVTNRFLARIDHPLVLVYGDITTQQSASLTALLYLLNREENRFIDLSANGGSQPYSQYLRELLVETVLGTVPRARDSLLRNLDKVASASAVSMNDVPFVLMALVVLADNALVLRPRQQFVVVAQSMVSEWLREACEEERRGMRGLVPNLRNLLSENGLRMVTEYSKVWIKPLASAVHALVPQDLYDNMEANGESPSVSELASFEVQKFSPDERWNDGSLPVVEILRKITMHATSLDRKASKRAILNATSNRQMSTFSSQVSSPCHSPNESRMPLSICERTITQQPSRCEHYFSFLRLYDTYEREGHPAAEFAAQLVFLALQLNPEYIGRYAREGIDVSSKDQCNQIAKLIMEKEEAPTTAEVIASPTRDGQQTDGFILRLMEMYAEREQLKETDESQSHTSNTNTTSRRPLYCYNPVYGGLFCGKKQ
ncbi:cAMP-specific phosphodiesterase [Trypanosoma theileri]|uniref:cAMP-specific phosphodiesterase n=1 Tax=Trypanosoma theileri TaxID=67003 RepID=A0A1X0NMW5_9TRYP|nr:cAMP-specific phosphodiesterase [Trypanosoma theileri]ORC85479.1 cAMP-specific phosphodiesterase [Trypanosoma theileri]